jgi:hypothetical protein
MTTAWKRTAVSAFVVISFTALMFEGASNWHAPSVEVLVPLFAFGILFGLGVNLLRARAVGPSADEPDDAIAVGAPLRQPPIVDVTSTSHSTHALAALLGAVTSLFSGILLGLAMQDWQQLFLASLVGAIYMGTWPLQVVAAHALLAPRLSIGIDGVRVDRRRVPFHEIREAVVSAQDGVIEIRCHDSAVVRHRCTSLEVARDLTAKISARLASSSPPEVATTRVARDGRSLEAWRRELLGAAYREREITNDDASRILRSGAATPDERVGAALILAGRAEGEDRDRERTRIRVAASACIDRRLRVALERVADDELDDATLDELSDRQNTSTPVRRGS